MDRYELSTQIGDGSFGRVMKATSKETGDTVAIKHIKRKFKTWKACIDLREVQSLRMTRHPNIVKMMEVIREKDESLYFVFEYLPDGTLYDLIQNSTNTKSLTKSSENRSKSILSHQAIVSIMKQVMSGLAFMNSKGFFHRDIKPENLLVDLSNHNVMDGKGILIKIADLGLARTMTPPFTYYVSTRWYRAPEVILHAPHYGPAIDMFACGLIVWELYTLHPLFPGTSEIDQIHKMMKLLGSPERKWGEGMLLMNKLNVRFENVEHVENAVIEVRICRDVRGKIDAANLICKLIQWDPEERPNATEALMHEYFGDAAHTLGPDACARTDQKYTEFNRDSGTRFRLQNNDENRHKQWPRASIDEDSMRETTEKEDNATNRFWRNGSRMEQQPNEFCDYLNAVTSSEVGGSLLNHQTIPRSGPQQPALTSSVKFKPCALLSHATPYKSSMSNVAQTNVRSTKRHGRRSLNRPNRNRVSEKPSWLLANQSMGRRAVEVTIGHSCKAGAQQMNHRNEERDSVWNPF